MASTISMKYIITVLSTNEVDNLNKNIKTEYSYSTLESAKSSFSMKCKKLKLWGEKIFELKGDFYTTLIVKRTYRNRFDAVSIKLEKKLEI